MTQSGGAPRKKLLMITHDFPPLVGGLATHAFGVARSLTELGWDVCVQTPFNGPFRSEWPGDRFSFTYTPARQRPLWRMMSTAWGALRWRPSDRFDAILVVHWRGCGMGGWIASRRTGAPYFLAVHGTDVLRASRSRVQRRVFMFLAGRARGCIAGGRYPAEIIRGLGVDGGRLYTMMEGLLLGNSRGVSESESREFRARKGWMDRQVILTVARLEERKGHDRVIEAVAQLKSKYPRILYVIVGRGEEENRIREEIRRRGLGNHVVLEGHVSNEDLPLCYAGSDLFVMPNREVRGDVEGFGISFLEAGFHGRPVIGGRSGGATDAIEDGTTGFLVDPQNLSELTSRIRQLLADTALAARLGAAGRERVMKSFNYPAVAGGLDAFLRSRL